MIQQEKRNFDAGAKVWVRRYENLHNLPHWHEEEELIVCQAGAAELRLEEGTFPLLPGQCAFVGREETHSITGAEGSRVAVAQFTGLFDTPLRLAAPVFADRYGAGERLDRLDRESREKAPLYAAKMNALITALMVDIFRGEGAQPAEAPRRPATERFEGLLEMLERHSPEMDFGQAVRFMHMSPAYFSRYFRRMTGMTFTRYLNLLRVDRAVALLAKGDGATMAGVMAECGFGTLRSFNRAFKAVTGYAPTRLPRNYSLDRRALLAAGESFDPTQEGSIELEA